MLIKNWKKEIWTLPNLLSLFRLLLIPTYIFIYLNANHSSDYWIAAGILTVSCITDLVDGKIARRFNMTSTLGKILDPLADKATQLTLFLCLVIQHKLLWHLVGIFIVKEGFQIIAGGIHWCKGKILKGALISGKICTAVLFVSLIILVVFPGINTMTANLIILVDSIFMMVSFINYLLAYFNEGDYFQLIESQKSKDHGAE